MIISKFISNKNDTLLNAMEVINNNKHGVTFVVNNENKLCGVITDGDIRRALLNNHKLDEKIENILKNRFIYAYDDETYEELLVKKENKNRTIPIVNRDMEVVNFFEFKQKLYFPVAEPNLEGNEYKYLNDAFLSSWISSSGEYINKFEKEFSKYIGTKYGVATSNGTTALSLALAALDIKDGDEVILPDFTFAATINTVIHLNAKPVIVDIEKESWCIDPIEIEKAITPKTKAIIPVHIYGQPCNMEKIMDIAEKHNLFVIEDCAQAHGAKYGDKKIGSFGHISCFSFFGNKVITTGEGGMCLTDSEELDEKMRVLRDHGMSKTKRYWHEVVGYNFRMTNLQAAIGVAQLERIDTILENRKKYEQAYKNTLKEFNYITYQKSNLENREKITWLASILVDTPINRDALIVELKEIGIDARPFFYPLSVMEIYKDYLFSNKNSIELSKKGLNLPTYASLYKLDKIVENLEKVVENLEKK